MLSSTIRRSAPRLLRQGADEVAKQTHQKSKSRRLLKFFAGIGLTASVGAGFVYYKYKTDEVWNIKVKQFERPIRFWTETFPVYAHYRVTEWLIKDKDDETQTKEFQELHTKYAPRMLDLALSLRGLYIKLGQVGTTRADVLPKTYRDCFQTLLDKVPSMEGSEVRAIVEKSLGKKIEDVFEYFDDEALGAASIGQAHVARLKDGREVVVKVQYPDAKHLFETDFDTARDFCELAQPEHLPIFNEMKAQFMTEFDFEREAWALDVVGKNIMPYFPDVIIPRPIPELSTDLVVVMEKVNLDTYFLVPFQCNSVYKYLTHLILNCNR